MNENTQPKAKKSLGQHFLRHESICKRIASLLLPRDTDNVIEIGPGPGAFSPPPRVDSAVLSFEPLPLDQRPERPELLALVIKICFQQRRKQLGSIARRCPPAPWLSAAIEQAGITPTLRPEQLTVADFQHISRFGASLLDNPLKN